MKSNTRFLERVQRLSPEIFEKSALERNEIAYIPRFLCQTSLPKDLQKINEWNRSFHRHKYTFLSPTMIGIPGGAYSRLIIIRFTTLAKLSNTRQITIEDSQADFMRWIGCTTQSGGKNGNLATFKEHFVRSVNCVFHTESSYRNKIDYSMIHIPDEISVTNAESWSWQTKMLMHEAFYNRAKKAIPTDIGALRCLSPGTLRMDIFNFLVMRLFYLKESVIVPWSELYAMFATPGVANKVFRQKFRIALSQALVFYEGARVELNTIGLVLDPSPMLIQPIKK